MAGVLRAHEMVDVLLASKLDGCFSSVLEAAASMGRHGLLGALLEAFSSSSHDRAAELDVKKHLGPALLAAVAAGHTQCVQQLIESCSSSAAALQELLDARDGNGRTALMKAALHGAAECMRLLLEHSPQSQVTAVTSLGSSALMIAASKGASTCLQLLLEHSPDIQVDAADAQGWKALMKAAQNGHSSCVQLLLQHSPHVQLEARVTMSDSGFEESTALMLAAYKGHSACIELLLQHSPDIQVAAVDVDGWNALMMAACQGHSACMQLLLEHSPGVQLKAETIAGGMEGQTALVMAAGKGHSACMEVLLAHSPDEQVAAVDEYGWNASMMAAKEGNSSCLQLLLNHSPGIQVAAAASDGRNALMIAAEGSDFACMELLLAHSPDVQMAAVNADDLTAITAIHDASGAAQCLQLLVPHCTSQQQLDSALLKACGLKASAELDEQQRISWRSCVELLLGRGAKLGSNPRAEDVGVVWPIVSELAARALVPDMAHQAVVGLALAATAQHGKRQADEEAGGSRKLARSSQ